jgi:D-alanyl-D-alanine carboxypeptidase/D-alanyl-D-alanine-endopeptidase (penicillin-binding protein 4)
MVVMNARRVGVLLAAALLAGCTSAPAASTTTRPAGSASSSSARPADLPAAIGDVMDKTLYAQATWSLLVTDVDTGESLYALNPDVMSFTGSTRKLFSVGAALDQLGADARQPTPVYRQGTVDDSGLLTGNLVLVGGGDLAFGGRRIDANTVQYTDFDHNDANGLGTAILTPQDPLFAVDDLARQVRAAGITSVSGDVVVDDRLFQPYRVPNGNLLVTPVMLNENQVDVTVTPGDAGGPATVAYRPETAALTVDGSVITGAAGSAATVQLSAGNRPDCIGTPGCTAAVTGSIPAGYTAPLSGEPSFVGTFRIERPNDFVRTAFIQALGRAGVAISAPAVAVNPTSKLSSSVRPGTYPTEDRLAEYESAPFAQTAQLTLKVSLNLGANLSVSLLGLTRNRTTIDGALAAERQILTSQYGVDGAQFDFPTNGSGTPDSRATPRALVQMLTAMSKSDVATQYRQALPVLGVDGSLATVGQGLPAQGQVFAKPGTTILSDDAGLILKAQNLAGYIRTASGRTVAYALMVNDVGTIPAVSAVSEVFADEAAISNAIYEAL